MEQAQRLLDEGAAKGWYPLARAVVFHQGRRVFEGGVGGAGPELVFDLASLTKILSTTAAFAALWADGTVTPETPVARFFPRAALAAAGVTVGDLLTHRSGAPAFVPFFLEAMAAHPELLSPGCPPALRLEVRREVVSRALGVAPVAPRGAAAVYSDVGFVVLGELLSDAATLPLEGLFEERVATPLGLSAHFRRLSGAGLPLGRVAATGSARPREPAPGQSGWTAGAHLSPPGEVDDDNAWVMDGVAGHAGLFGTCDDVAAFGQAVLDGVAGKSPLAPAVVWSQVVRRDAGTPGSSRALGFDTPTPGPEGPSSAGAVLGDRPPGAVGHLGFTGTSLWVDLSRQLVVALCTNRTANGRAQVGIRALRPAFHDAVVAALKLA